MSAGSHIFGMCVSTVRYNWGMKHSWPVSQRRVMQRFGHLAAPIGLLGYVGAWLLLVGVIAVVIAVVSVFDLLVGVLSVV